MPRFWQGATALRQWGYSEGRRGGAPASPATVATLFLGGTLVCQTNNLRFQAEVYVYYAGFVVNFIQLVHSFLVQEVNPGVDTGIAHSIASCSYFGCECRFCEKQQKRVK
jgi:hypothetical protein